MRLGEVPAGEVSDEERRDRLRLYAAAQSVARKKVAKLHHEDYQVFYLEQRIAMIQSEGWRDRISDWWAAEAVEQWTLELRAARAAQARAREAVDRPPAQRRATSVDEAPCPLCAADAGARCVTPGGWPTDVPHRARSVAAYERARAALWRSRGS